MNIGRHTMNSYLELHSTVTGSVSELELGGSLSKLAILVNKN